MTRTTVLQEVRQMRFEELYERRQRRDVTMAEAAELLGATERRLRWGSLHQMVARSLVRFERLNVPKNLSRTERGFLCVNPVRSIGVLCCGGIAQAHRLPHADP